MSRAAPSRTAPATAAGDTEFQILCACASVQMDSQGASRLASLLHQPWDCDRLLQLAAQHGLGPLLCQHLGAQSAVPDPVKERLRVEQAQAARETLLLTQELLRLHAQLQRRGITVLAFKGPALAQMLYGGLGLRPFADLDIMIRRRDLPAARDVLQSNGYEPTVPIAPALESDYVRTQYEYGMLQAGSGIYAELQWAAAPLFYSVHFDEERFWTNAQALQLGSATLLTPSPADLALLLSVHAAKHAWGRLIWLADLSELIRRYPGLDWSQVLQTARTSGILDLVLITLLLAQRLVGAQLPAVVAATVSENPRITVLADRVQQAVAAGSAEFVSPSPAHFWLMFRVRERWSDRVRFVTRLALTPTHEEWNVVRLPRWLFPLYRVIRVVRALRHLPAVAAWLGAAPGRNSSRQTYPLRPDGNL